MHSARGSSISKSSHKADSASSDDAPSSNMMSFVVYIPTIRAPNIRLAISAESRPSMSGEMTTPSLFVRQHSSVRRISLIQALGGSGVISCHRHYYCIVGRNIFEIHKELRGPRLSIGVPALPVNRQELRLGRLDGDKKNFPQNCSRLAITGNSGSRSPADFVFRKAALQILMPLLEGPCVIVIFNVEQGYHHPMRPMRTNGGLHRSYVVRNQRVRMRLDRVRLKIPVETLARIEMCIPVALSRYGKPRRARACPRLMLEVPTDPFHLTPLIVGLFELENRVPPIPNRA